MTKRFSSFLWASLSIFALLNVVLIFLLPSVEGIAWLIGYLLGFFAVIVHLFSSLFIKDSPSEQFAAAYFLSLFVRFLIVCIIFVILLITTKIDEFSFTVSFIISYIFHSVNEVIFLNQKFSN